MNRDLCLWADRTKHPGRLCGLPAGHGGMHIMKDAVELLGMAAKPLAAAEAAGR